jgi:DNA-directed RNA polymerase subunit RPC12/RpoP
MVKFNMKIVYQEFFCPECGTNRWLRVENVCVDCRDKILLDKISQSRKMQSIFNEQICV